MTPELTRDGVLVTGDAAGFCINLGFTVRGMDFAIESGRLAAEAVIRANQIGDYSKAGLAYYELALKNSFIMRDMDQYKGFPTILTMREVFEDVPAMVDDIATKLFTVDGQTESIIMYIVNTLAQKTSARELVDLITKVLEAF